MTDKPGMGEVRKMDVEQARAMRDEREAEKQRWIKRALAQVGMNGS